ncbi:hypothetical protein ACFQZ4_22880 [Catellatospora coxensis]
MHDLREVRRHGGEVTGGQGVDHAGRGGVRAGLSVARGRDGQCRGDADAEHEQRTQPARQRSAARGRQAACRAVGSGPLGGEPGEGGQARP